MSLYADVEANVIAAIAITEGYRWAVRLFPSYVFEKEEFIEAADRMQGELMDLVSTQQRNYRARVANGERALERGDPVGRDVMSDLMRIRQQRAVVAGSEPKKAKRGKAKKGRGGR